MNPLMDVVVYWRYASLIMGSLDVYQYAARGQTIVMQCLNLIHAVTAPKSVEGWVHMQTGQSQGLSVGTTRVVVLHDGAHGMADITIACFSRIHATDHM